MWVNFKTALKYSVANSSLLPQKKLKFNGIKPYLKLMLCVRKLAHHIALRGDR